MTEISSNRETLNSHVTSISSSSSSLTGSITPATGGRQDCSPSQRMREVMGQISSLFGQVDSALSQDAQNLIKVAEVFEETDGAISGDLGKK